MHGLDPRAIWDEQAFGFPFSIKLASQPPTFGKDSEVIVKTLLGLFVVLSVAAPVAAQLDSAAMTVGHTPESPDGERFGYTDSGFNVEKGALEPAEFSYDGRTYIVHYVEHLPERDSLILGVSDPLPDRFALWLDGVPYASSEAAAQFDEYRVHQWWPVTIDWSEGDTVRVDITLGDEPVPVDRATLMALYEATDGANWMDNSGWGTAAPLDDWYGVRTHEEGRVSALALANNGLDGSIPGSLGNLSNLVELNLDYNELSGPIPGSLGDLSNLRTLRLQANGLSGAISSNLGNLSSLELLELDSETGLCLAADFPLESAFGRLAQELGLTLCDTTSPTVTITSVASEPVAGPFPVTVNFSERVTGFELADLVVGNGSASELQGDGAGYTATITPAASGTVTVDIAAGAARDDAGNPSTAAEQFSIIADTAAPTVTITSAASGPVTGPFPVTVNFSERVTGFELADLVVGNGSASELQGDGAGYTATVIPAASGIVTVDITAGAAEDSAGNPSAAADQFSITADLTPVPALPLAGAIVLALLLIRGARQRAART